MRSYRCSSLSSAGTKKPSGQILPNPSFKIVKPGRYIAVVPGVEFRTERNEQWAVTIAAHSQGMGGLIDTNEHAVDRCLRCHAECHSDMATWLRATVVGDRPSHRQGGRY